MWLHQFICFYCYFTLLRWHSIEAVSWHSPDSQLPDKDQAGDHKQVVRLQFDSPVFLQEDLELECSFCINSKQLYSIKWYKDEQEFFQYVPHEKPPVRSFASKGVRFKTPAYSITNDTFRLWLHSVNLDTEGTYRCEISTDAPDFTTLKDHKSLEIYVLPNKSPRISGSRVSFQPKGRVDLNCTSPKSKPVSTLQWFINDQLASNDYLIPYKQIVHADGLLTQTWRLRFIVNEEHFKNGKMLKCIATYQSNKTWIRRRLSKPSISSRPSAQPDTDNNASRIHLASSTTLAVTGLVLLYLASAATGDVWWYLSVACSDHESGLSATESNSSRWAIIRNQSNVLVR